MIKQQAGSGSALHYCGLSAKRTVNTCRYFKKMIKKIFSCSILVVLIFLCCVVLFFRDQRRVHFSRIKISKNKSASFNPFAANLATKSIRKQFINRNQTVLSISRHKISKVAMNSAVKDSRETGPTCKPDKSSIWGVCKEIVAKKMFYKNTEKKAMAWKPERVLTDLDVLQIVGKCPNFPSHFCFPTLPLTKEEADFPLAFILIIHANLDQIFRLLQSIYWPQNLYCVTYDEKSSENIKNFPRKLIKCFPNIITPESHETIYWGQFGVLKAAVECLKLMNGKSHQWKYVQILSGNDFPLKTNREMVEILKVLNGTSDSELAEGQRGRYAWHTEFVPKGNPIPASWKLKDTITDYGGTVFFDTSKRKSPIPHRLTVYKGSFAVTLSRQLANYAIRNPVALDFYQWLSDTYVPDEQFWATLIHNTQHAPPGGFPGSCLDYFGNSRKPFISRFHVWPDTLKFKCQGKYVHGSCLFGVRDLHKLVNAKSLVAHKIYMDFQPATFYCLKDWLNEKTYEMPNLKSLDMEYYRNLPAVKYRDKIEKKNDCGFMKQDKKIIQNKNN